MSQDDEETTKLNKQHQHYHYHDKHLYGQMRTNDENQQVVMPLYENYTLNKKPDQNLLTADLTDTIKSNEQYNTVYGFERNTSNIARDTYVNCESYEYENIRFDLKDTLDKRELLQKYFRSALVGPRSNIYENLCRGCNYGVFNARGPLCTFCECLVNGVSALRSNTPDTSLSNNIYENICEECGVIYSGSNCLECKCQDNFGDLKKSEEFLLQRGSEELLIDKKYTEKKKVKLNKSKSFSKTNKPKIFTNFWDTIRSNHKNKTESSKRKPLEIIHNVEGFEQVFHTKDTFDLQKICELKRSTTSCSDQHIYGRLKHTELDLSQEEFNSTQSLTNSGIPGLGVGAGGKRPRISKAKFLRTQTSLSSSNNTETEYEFVNCTIYLNTSVCHWMTSLRREIHVYTNNTLNQTEELLCYPKSIPSKNVLNSCKAPQLPVTQTQTSQQKITNIYKNSCSDLTEIVQMLKSHNNNSMTSMDSWNLEEEDNDCCYQLMVEEFMANIINRQMLKAKDTNRTKQENVNVKAAMMAGVNNNDIYTNNNNNTSQESISIDIPLRQTTMTAKTSSIQNNNNNNNRHKRQGMYLRLEDHHHDHLSDYTNKGEELKNLHNNNINNDTEQEFKSLEMREYKNEENNNNVNVVENSLNLTTNEYNTVTTSDTRLTNDLDLVKRDLHKEESKWNLIKLDKRKGIHERNVLQAFEALLEKEKSNHLETFKEENTLPTKSLNDQTNSSPFSAKESHKNLEELCLNENSLQLQTFGDNPQSMSKHFPKQIFNIIQLINQQQLSAGLNTTIICYDQYLKIFLQFFYQTNPKTRTIIYEISNKQLVRKFKQFYNYCEKKTKTKTSNPTIVTMSTMSLLKNAPTKPKKIPREITCVSSNLKLDLNITNGFNQQIKREIEQNIQNNNNNNESLNENKFENNVNHKVFKQQTDLKFPDINKHKVKTPPQVPKRDPKTKLSPTTEIKRFLNPTKQITKMTVPSSNLKTETSSDNKQEEEESIYQPIWKFETKGKVKERYQTDDDYYDLKTLKEKLQQESPNQEIPKILISNEILTEEEEDHNNWEPDEEFVFTKEMKKQRSSSLSSERNSSLRSTHSSNISLATNSSLSGSTITEFASSTATLASTFSHSLRHYLFRNIGIFYSLTEPKLRAIIYDYDRIHSSTYFAKLQHQSLNINDSGIGKSLSPIQPPKRYSPTASSTPSTSASSSPVAALKKEIYNKPFNNSSTSLNSSDGESQQKTKVPSSPPSKPSSPKQYQIPMSVQAWKYQLLDVNYMEDEEDMIVSECEILRAQQIKEELDQSHQSQPQQFIQRFKSRSTENFIDLPIEDDKKTFAERLANMYTRFSPIQRGILNINGRNSPKSDKKIYKQNRASQATSLCLDEGLNLKKPIFGAPLQQLELQQNVPRFVVDAVEYIERKDRIIQDGIYRACGNKFSIDELKQKLTKSYMYDSKLIVADDIHTVTSLLKQFFRDLPEPVIPQEIYTRITANLADKQGIDTIRIAIEEMKEPNKSTLRYLIKHLTNVAACSSSNRMNASNVAIVWGPSLFAQNDTYDMIGRMNTLTKVLIENYDRIFDTNERLL